MLVIAASVIFTFMWLWDKSSSVRASELAEYVKVIGFSSIAVAAFKIYYDGKVRVRSQNRQDWINEVRKEINFLIANFPPPGSTHREILAAQQKFVDSHTKLELRLNPHERLHRAVMALIRGFYFAEPNPIDKKANDELHFSPLVEGSSHNFSVHDPGDDPKNQIPNWNGWKSRVIRLSNVLLKREWEQVKYVR